MVRLRSVSKAALGVGFGVQGFGVQDGLVYDSQHPNTMKPYNLKA